LIETLIVVRRPGAAQATAQGAAAVCRDWHNGFCLIAAAASRRTGPVNRGGTAARS